MTSISMSSNITKTSHSKHAKIMITGVTLSPNTGVADSASGIVIGTLTASSSGGYLTGVSFSLTNNDSGNFELIGGNEIAFLSNSVAAGTHTITVQVSASNANNSPQSYSVSITIAAAAPASSGITVSLYDHGGVGIPQGTLHTFGQAFKEGDVPADSFLVGLYGTTTQFAVQQDCEATWPDGSLRMASLSLQLPAAIPINGSIVVSLARATGTPNRTGITAAQIAANSNIVLTLSGYDCGSNTYQVSVNDIIVNFSQFPWGTSNPLGGWRYRRQGPNATTIEAWRYLKNSSTGNPHAYVKAHLFVTCRGNNPAGPYDVHVWLRQDNSYGPVSPTADGASAGTLGGRFFCTATITNNGITIGQLGGASDWRAAAGVTFDATTNKISAPPNASAAAPFSLYGNVGNLSGLPVSFSSTGSLPSLLSSSTSYLYFYDTITSAYYLTPSRAAFNIGEIGPNLVTWVANTIIGQNKFVWVNNQYFFTAGGGTTGTTSPSGNADTITDGTVTWIPVTIAFGTNGSGTITVFPAWGCYQNAGQVGEDRNADPFWTGSGARPRIGTGHNFVYLQSAKAIPRSYDPSFTLGASTLLSAPFNPGYVAAAVWAGSSGTWNVSDVGAGQEDERFPLFSPRALCSFYAPGNAAFAQALKSQTYSDVDFPWAWADERGNAPIILNNGHAKDGAAYANLPAPNPNYMPMAFELGGASPAPGNVRFAPAVAGNDWKDNPGYSQQSQSVGASFFDTSHWPTFWFPCYLKTGDPMLLEMGLLLANAAVGFPQGGKNVTISGTTYYCQMWTATQTRGVGRGLDKLFSINYALPDAHPCRQYVSDLYADNAAGWVAQFPSQQPTNAGALGFLSVAGPPNLIDLPWQYAVVYWTLCQEDDRGLDANWHTARLYVKRFMSMFDDTQSGGCSFETGMYEIVGWNSSGTDTLASAPLIFANSYTQLFSQTYGSCPASGIMDFYSNPNAAATVRFGNDASVMWLAAIKYQELLDADGFFSALKTRITSVGAIDYNSNTGAVGTCPQYNTP
jgi:hypothetical protein